MNTRESLECLRDMAREAQAESVDDAEDFVTTLCCHEDDFNQALRQVWPEEAIMNKVQLALCGLVKYCNKDGADFNDIINDLCFNAKGYEEALTEAIALLEKK